MRKMTKTAAVLAAMSAMTVASASMAFAAAKEVTDVKALNTPGEIVEAGENAGSWSGSSKDGWKFTLEDGTKLKDTWAQIDGVWYYFNGDKIVQDDLQVIDDKTYFFHADGSMMADGWYKVTSDMDAYEKIEIGDQLLYSNANTYVNESHAYDYLDYVWLYFGKDGVAKENEWMQDENQYWFYFDGNVTVMNMYNFAIAPHNLDYANSSNTKLYGFDENGCMLTGWNSIDRKNVNWNDPTADDNGDIWFYYAPKGGAMLQEGWASIDGNWYLFASNAGSPTVGSDAERAKSVGYPLVVNSYVESHKNSTTTESFYVDNKGVMQTGVVTVPKGAYKIDFYLAGGGVSTDWEDTASKVSANTTAYFGTKGAATSALVNGKFYLNDTNAAVYPVVSSNISQVSGTKYVYDYTSAANVTSSAVTGGLVSVAVSGNGAGTWADTDIAAQMVKNAFVVSPKNASGSKIANGIYLADSNGNLVTNRAVLLETGTIKVTLQQEGLVASNTATFSEAYILFDGNGKAYTETKKTVRIGNVSYWATTSKVTIGGQTATVYVSSKDN